MRKWVVVSAAVAPVAPVAAWALAQSRQPPGYDPVRQTISVLSEHGATDRWLMTVGLLILGSCYVLTAIGLIEVGMVGRSLLAVGGLATIGTAAFPQPAPEHVIAAGIAFVALASWPIFSLAPALSTRIAVALAELALLAWFAFQIAGGDMLGLSERVLAAAEAMWPLIVVLTILTEPRTRPRHAVSAHRQTSGRTERLGSSAGR